MAVERFLGPRASQIQGSSGRKGPTVKLQHCIRLKTDQPIKQWYRPRNPAMQAIINNEVEEMLENGVIELSRSA